MRHILTLKAARKVIAAVFGVTLLLAGIIMIVTPGPAFVLIPAGLAVLATEFLWARHLLQKVRDRVGKESERLGPRRSAQIKNGLAKGEALLTRKRKKAPE